MPVRQWRDPASFDVGRAPIAAWLRRGVTVVHVLEEGRDAGHREDTSHGVTSVHECEPYAACASCISTVDQELDAG